MEKPEIPVYEENRLLSLRCMRLLDTPSEERFDRITRLAQRFFNVPMALISLVDKDREWFKSKQGLDVTETPRDISFSGHAILGDKPFVVPDASQDPRFFDNPLVAGEPHIRFYCGVPLSTPDRQRIGTLAIIDRHSRSLSSDQLKTLQDLSALIENEFAMQDVSVIVNQLRDTQSFFDRSLDLICSYGPDGIVKTINPQWESKLGYSRKELLNTPITNFVHPEDRERTIKELDLVFKGKNYVDFECRFITKEGIAKWFSWTAIKSNSENIIHIEGRDITESRSAEVKLLETFQILEAQKKALDQFAIVAETDANGIITYVNQKFCEISQYSESELIGKSHQIINSGLHPPQFWKFFWDQIKNGRVWRGEICNRSKDGTLYWVDSTVVPFLGPDNKPFKYLAMRIVITEKKLAEERLQSLATIVETSIDAIIGKSVDGTIISWNHGAELTYGYSAKEAIGKNIRIILPPEKIKEFNLIMKDLRNGESRTLETVRVRKDGTPVDVSLRITAIKNDSGEVIGGSVIARDITALKQAEKNLIVAKEQAEAATRAKSDFLANMSHEIRTPMNSVLGMTNLLIKSALSKRQYDYAQTLRSSAGALLHIINDILDFSKIEAGKFKLDSIDFSLIHTVEETVNVMSRLAHEKELILVSIIEDEVPEYINGDPGRLRQILLNLLSNAIKFTERGQVMLRIRSQKETDTTETIFFEVLDTGIGIANEVIPHLFQSFYQADESSTRRYGGTGLGLAICKKIVEQMGGQISVESQLGKGSLFKFFLNVRKSTTDIASSSKENEIFKGKEILVVDHRDTIRLALGKQAHRLGATVLLAENASKAFNIIMRKSVTSSPISVILLDQNLPDMSGLKLSSTLKAKSLLSKSKIILMSDFDDVPQREKWKKLGLSGYLKKPFRTEQLRELLLQILKPPKSRKNSPQKTKQIKKIKKSHVLLAEDNLANQKLAKILLQDMGFKVKTVNNGQKAVTAVKEEKFDVILMDCQMPEMDGYAATQEIRKLAHPHVPIIALTAHAFSADKKKCLDSGMDDVVTKPIDATELERKLISWISAKPKLRSNKPSTFYELTNTMIPSKSKTGASTINPNRLLQLTRNDKVKAHRLMDIYVRQTQTEIGLLKTAIQNKNQPEIYRLSHGNAGASESYGMEAMGKLLRELERISKEMQLKNAEPVMELIEAEFEAIKIALKEF